METLFILKEIILKKHITDTTAQKTGNKGDYSLQQGNIYFNDQNNTGKIANFIKATRGIVRLVIPVAVTYLLYVMLSCMLEQVEITLNQTLLLGLKEQILYKSLTLLLLQKILEPK